MKATLSRRERKETMPLDPARVRGELAFRHLTIRAWASARGYRDAYVHLAMRGQRRGPVALRIVAALRADLGV